MHTVAGAGDPGATGGAEGEDVETEHGGLERSLSAQVQPNHARRAEPSGQGGEPRRLVSPETADTISKAVGAAAVIGATIFVVWQLRLGLIFSHNMDVGGDNGGHVAAPYYLIHDLLPHLRITGWDPWWFDGMPLYVFYFPLPALLVAAFSVVLPYNQAFNVVTILGTVTLPVSAWAFGTLARFRRPVPVLMALVTLPYLFNTSYTIDGGNLTSTLAGEFSFSLAISVGLLFLGVFVHSLRTGRLRWLAAVLFAMTVLCHLVPALCFGVVAAFIVLARLRWSSLKIAAAIGVTGALLVAFWLVPFAADLQYSSSMGYLRVGGLHAPLDPHGFVYELVPAALGVVIGLVRGNRVVVALGLAAAGSALSFWKMPAGLVYNGRWLPFWFLFVGLLAAYAIGEALRLVGGLLRRPRTVSALGTGAAYIGCAAAAAIAGGLIGAFPGVSPQGNQIQVQGWVSWNYTGFQGKSGWPEFSGMIDMLDKAGQRYGCGRLQYEYLSETTDPFGSTEAMMSIPMWTKGCIQSTDGIYFESSTTTPYHFLDMSELSQNGEASDPISYLSYPGFDLPDGIRHLQLMGVKYFLAMSPPVEAQAAADPSLVRIGQSTGFPGPINGVPDPKPVWQLYLVKDSPLVKPLSYLPEVEPSNAQKWLDTNLAWYERENYWPVELARSGPPSWPHARVGTLVPQQRAIPVAPTTVSDVRTTNSSISFRVSRLGTPVLVKIPYFPNWAASGATGPYETSPNLMVVVPTSHQVTLNYRTDLVDWAGKAGSLLGLAALCVMAFTRPPDPGAPLRGDGPIREGGSGPFGSAGDDGTASMKTIGDTVPHDADVAPARASPEPEDESDRFDGRNDPPTAALFEDQE